VLGQQRIRVRGEAERGERVRPDRRPLGTFQQLGLRVAPPGGGIGVDLAALQAAPEPLQHAEGVGVPVHRPVLARRVPEHQALPRTVHHLRVDQAARDQRGGQAAAVGEHLRQRLHCLQHRRSLGVRTELDRLGQHLQKPRHGGVATDQLGPPVVRIGRVRRQHVLVHQHQRGAQFSAGDDGLDHLPHLRHPRFPLRAAPPVGLEQRLNRDRQPCRRPRQLRVLADLLLVGGVLRLVHQLGRHQQIQQFQGVVDRLALQEPDSGQQRRQPPAVRMAPQRRGVRAHPVPGQLSQPALRDQSFGAQVRQLQALNLRHLIQSLDDGRAGRPRRDPLAPSLQVRHPRARRNLQQLVQDVPLADRQQPLQHAPLLITITATVRTPSHRG
jgi:hypothetical protein